MLTSGILPTIQPAATGAARPAFVYGGVGFYNTYVPRPAIIVGHSVADLNVDTSIPTATLLTMPAISTPAASPELLQVEYKDGVSLQLSSIGSGNLNVLLPGASHTTEVATYLGIVSGTAQDLKVDYALAPIGGVWTASQNGTYTIALLANQVSNGTHPVAANANFGSFAVNVPSVPTAVLTPVPNVTTAGSNSVNLTVSYSAVNAPVRSSTIVDNDLPLRRYHREATRSRPPMVATIITPSVARRRRT